MRVNELRQALRQAEPAAVLVSQGNLDRVIREVWKLPALTWTVPHRKCFVLDRQDLFRHLEQDDLALEPDRRLPQTVILLSQPSPETLNSRDPEHLWVKYWRRLFHACVHLALESPESPTVLPHDVVATRVEQIGRAAFEEARHVLTEDHYLPPGASDRHVYIELASVYLELRKFAPHLVRVYFPGLGDHDAIDAMLACDVDAEAIYQRTRLRRMADPTPRTDTNSDESHDFYWGLVRTADEIRDEGNLVRAAILRTQAARVAPADLAMHTRAAAECELRALGTRMQAALQLSDDEVDEWLEVLPALLEKADQGKFPVEAAILFDLQKACVDSERDLYALDLVEWGLSGGKKPIKRWLPSVRLVRVTSHLRTASQLLARARLTDADRRKLSNLMQKACREGEERLRARFGTVLRDAMHDAGLVAQNPLEKTASAKVVEECLDRIVAHGFLTFSDLRDTLSRNQFKLPDLREPQDFVKGDPLLRLDRRLSFTLDGVYRPGEIYLRWLERSTALLFGTGLGRWITLFLILPFLGAYLLLMSVDMVLHLVSPAWHIFPVQPTTPSPAEQAFAEPAAGVPVAPDAIPPPLTWQDYLPAWVAVFVVGLVLMALLHRPALRVRLRAGLRYLGRGVRLLLVDVPLWLVHVPILRRMVESWPFQLFYWYAFKPVLLTLLTVVLFRRWVAEDILLRGGLIFIVTNLVVNSRPGKAASEFLVRELSRAYHLIRTGLFWGLVRLVLDLFKRMVESLEAALYRVNEWLQFRSGETTASMVFRAILGLIWFPIAYTLRFVMVVLIEPFINPIKMPLTILSAKIVYPLTLPLLFKLGTFDQTAPLDFDKWALAGPLHDLGGLGWVVFTLSFVFWWFFPDAPVFLVWELKENWKLYKSNRSATLQPVVIGAHGETLRMLMEPGFHSGTVPRLYRKLREAEREGADTGDWGAVRSHRAALAEIEESVERFINREMLVLLRQSHSWRDEPVRLGHVTLASNRVRIELDHDRYPGKPVVVEFELRAGWLTAGVREEGWLPQTTSEQRHAFVSALAHLYKLAGIDLVYEHLCASLPSEVKSYDLDQEGLIVWPEERPGPAYLYPLREAKSAVSPEPVNGSPVTTNLPALEARALLFSRAPLSWDEMVSTWQSDQAGQGHRETLSVGPLLNLSNGATPAKGPDDELPAPYANGQTPPPCPDSGG